MTPAVVVGLVFHEYAHGLAAYSLGDRTAYRQGRLTLNPAAHIDILGLLMLYIAGFGWARPVPVNPFNLRGNMHRGLLLVSLAGPLANMIIAIIAAVLYGAFLLDIPYLNRITMEIININVILAVFNLLPVPPLDGSKILAGLWPAGRQWLYNLEQYGPIILVLLLVTGLIGRILGIFLDPVFSFLGWLVRTVNVVF
ncbi:MAG: site-2 protease family protein [Peptococcaceae bacterium]|nr:site-2 protease family protein [Peptococcaceae bacterium]